MAAEHFLLLSLCYCDSFGLLLSHFGHDSPWPRCLPQPVREPRTIVLTLVNLSLALLSLTLRRFLALASRKLYSVA
jgi:hypothetical protein